MLNRDVPNDQKQTFLPDDVYQFLVDHKAIVEVVADGGDIRTASFPGVLSDFSTLVGMLQLNDSLRKSPIEQHRALSPETQPRVS